MPYQMLFADDSATMHRVMQITLAGEDIHLVGVMRADEARERARTTRFDAALIDVDLAGEDGYLLCQQLKRDPDVQDLPVCLLAGGHQVFDEARARAVGADAHIIKPFESQSLIALMLRLMAPTSQEVDFKEEPTKKSPPLQAPVEQARTDGVKKNVLASHDAPASKSPGKNVSEKDAATTRLPARKIEAFVPEASAAPPGQNSSVGALAPADGPLLSPHQTLEMDLSLLAEQVTEKVTRHQAPAAAPSLFEHEPEGQTLNDEKPQASEIPQALQDIAWMNLQMASEQTQPGASVPQAVEGPREPTQEDAPSLPKKELPVWVMPELCHATEEHLALPLSITPGPSELSLPALSAPVEPHRAPEPSTAPSAPPGPAVHATGPICHHGPPQRAPARAVLKNLPPQTEGALREALEAASLPVLERILWELLPPLVARKVQEEAGKSFRDYIDQAIYEALSRPHLGPRPFEAAALAGGKFVGKEEQ